MVEQHQAQRRGRVLGGIRPTSEDHRVTTFELLFDLVYVFAATQVTGYMAHAHSAHGVLQGLLLLALLWWTWSGYTWLGNQARADGGPAGGHGRCDGGHVRGRLDHSRGLAGRARRPERAAGRLHALPLFGGVALYLAGHLLFKQRMYHSLSLPRLGAIGVLLAALPAAVVLPPLVGLAGLVVILSALIVVETTKYAPVRRSLRGRDGADPAG